VRLGELAVVIGGGPIGLLVGLVAQAAGADVVLSEPNAQRLALARSFGFAAVDPLTEDLGEVVEAKTAGAGADVVFEVSGSAAGAATMTQLPGLRGRVVVVAIFPEPQPISLFDVFWKELRIAGARVYEPEDYERAIALVAGGSLPLERLVTSVEPLQRLPEIFQGIGERTSDVKILVDCGGRR
jgi:2-desacetyl-2-hydroxyethyl bacteriochlorophyllide A dehydrogenase